MLPNSPQGYVLVGTNVGEKKIYVTGFDEFGQHQWTRSHALPADITYVGQVQKAVTVTSGTVRYFVCVEAFQGSAHKAYALLLNAAGMKIWDRVSPLADDLYGLSAVTNATNGGWVATSSTDGGFALVKFDAYGNVQWVQYLIGNDYSATNSIVQAVGGGYVAAGYGHAIKTDHLGAIEWVAPINLGNGPNGSPYDSPVNEEITVLPNGAGFIVTGRVFDGQYTAVYVARLSWTGTVAWVKTLDATNLFSNGYPFLVSYNAIVNGPNELVVAWGRINDGNPMRYQRLDFNGNLIGAIGNFGNTQMGYAGFLTKAHGKFVIGGATLHSSGDYLVPYSYVNAALPLAGYEANDRYSAGSGDAPTSFTVSPNPTSGLLTISGDLEAGALLRVISPMGAVVIERHIRQDENSLQLDLGGFPSGIYTLVMAGKEATVVKKVMRE